MGKCKQSCGQAHVKISVPETLKSCLHVDGLAHPIEHEKKGTPKVDEQSVVPPITEVKEKPAKNNTYPAIKLTAHALALMQDHHIFYQGKDNKTLVNCGFPFDKDHIKELLTNRLTAYIVQGYDDDNEIDKLIPKEIRHDQAPFPMLEKEMMLAWPGFWEDPQPRPENWEDNENYIWSQIFYSPQYFEKASERLRNNEEIIFTAAESQYVLGVMFQCTEYNSNRVYALERVPQSLIENEKFAKRLMTIHPLCPFGCTRFWDNQKEMVIEALKLCWNQEVRQNVYRYADPRLQIDPDVCAFIDEDVVEQGKRMYVACKDIYDERDKAEALEKSKAAEKAASESLKRKRNLDF